MQLTAQIAVKEEFYIGFIDTNLNVGLDVIVIKQLVKQLKQIYLYYHSVIQREWPGPWSLRDIISY